MNNLASHYDLITKATAFFEGSDKVAAASGFAIGSATWFTCECRHSVHRESIFGRETFYDKD